MFNLWTESVKYTLGDIVQRNKVIPLKRKPSRFNKKRIQMVARKEFFKVVL